MELNGTMDVHYRGVCQAGVGAVVHFEEEVPWEKKIIGDHNPLALRRAVFFYAGKAFCLRGGEELYMYSAS